MHRRRRSAGSITPVWVALILTTLLLLVLFVEREWVNHQVRKVEQTADFAAEVGSASATIIYHLHIVGRTGSWVQEADAPPCDPCGTHPVIAWADWTNDCSGTLAEISPNGWLSRCDCFVGSVSGLTTPWHECTEVKETEPEIKWPANLEDQVLQTFDANWVNRPNSRVVYSYVYPDPALDKRLTRLTVKLLVSSPFGGEKWFSREFYRTGQATIRIPPLKITTPS